MNDAFAEVGILLPSDRRVDGVSTERLRLADNFARVVKGFKRQCAASSYDVIQEQPPALESQRLGRHLAAAVFRWQLAHCPPYRRFCEGRGIPAAVSGDASAQAAGSKRRGAFWPS